MFSRLAGEEPVWTGTDGDTSLHCEGRVLRQQKANAMDDDDHRPGVGTNRSIGQFDLDRFRKEAMGFASDLTAPASDLSYRAVPFTASSFLYLRAGDLDVAARDEMSRDLEFVKGKTQARKAVTFLSAHLPLEIAATITGIKDQVTDTIQMLLFRVNTREWIPSVGADVEEVSDYIREQGGIYKLSRRWKDLDNDQRHSANVTKDKLQTENADLRLEIEALKAGKTVDELKALKKAEVEAQAADQRERRHTDAINSLLSKAVRIGDLNDPNLPENIFVFRHSGSWWAISMKSRNSILDYIYSRTS